MIAGRKQPPSYLDAKETRPLTKQETAMFLDVLMFSREQGDLIVHARDLDAEIRKISPELADSFFIKAMTLRLAGMTDLSFSAVTLIWCARLSDRIGVAIHWAYTLVEYERKFGKPMTLSDWVDQFPMGPPTVEDQERLWDLQKLYTQFAEDRDDSGSDNRLDSREAWANTYIEAR